MARVNRHVKVTIDGPRSKIVHDFIVQCKVCLKMPVHRDQLRAQSSVTKKALSEDTDILTILMCRLAIDNG